MSRRVTADAAYVIARLHALVADLESLSPEMRALLAVACTETVLQLSQLIEREKAKPS